MKNLIEIFEKVREEPLKIPKNRCWEKSKKLKKELEKLGYQVKEGLCSFKWSEQKLPKDILKTSHKDLGYHLFLLVKVKDDFLIVDPANDSGLPFYNKWDGKTNCNLGVIPQEIYKECSKEQIEQKEKFENESYKKYFTFYDKINKFLEKIRKTNN